MHRLPFDDNQFLAIRVWIYDRAGEADTGKAGQWRLGLTSPVVRKQWETTQNLFSETHLWN